MYKKLHTPEKVAVLEPLSTKGSFLGCVPERDIMLTNLVYRIQPKTEKNYPILGSFFLLLGLYAIGFYERMPHGVLCSLFNKPKNIRCSVLKNRKSYWDLISDKTLLFFEGIPCYN